jgi:hypothetical protein
MTARVTRACCTIHRGTVHPPRTIRASPETFARKIVARLTAASFAIVVIEYIFAPYAAAPTMFRIAIVFCTSTTTPRAIAPIQRKRFTVPPFAEG